MATKTVGRRLIIALAIAVCASAAETDSRLAQAAHDGGPDYAFSSHKDHKKDAPARGQSLNRRRPAYADHSRVRHEMLMQGRDILEPEFVLDCHVRPSRPPNEWRINGERRAEGVRCTRILGAGLVHR